SIVAQSYRALEAGTDRLLDAEHAVLPEALLIGVDDLDDLGLVRRRVEDDHDEALAALTHDATGGLAVLARRIEHAEPIGKPRRHDLRHEGPPPGIRPLPATGLVAAEVEIDRDGGLQRRGADGRHARLGAGADRESNEYEE